VKTPTFTEEQWVERLWDVENVKQLMTKRCYYIYNDKHLEELEDFWVQEPENRKTASYGSNWGYYVGMDEIRKYYVQHHKENMEKRAARYGTAADKTGYMNMHTLSTPLVKLAQDGKTCRGMWYDMNAFNDGNPDGTAQELLLPWQVACDFVKENGQWRIWHLFMSNDMFITIGKPVSEIPIYPAPGEDPVRVEFGEPTIPMLAHDNTFGWGDMYPPMPEAYTTYDSNNSYGPEGHPSIRKLQEVFL
jgi:hypothetical protein